MPIIPFGSDLDTLASVSFGENGCGMTAVTSLLSSSFDHKLKSQIGDWAAKLRGRTGDWPRDDWFTRDAFDLTLEASELFDHLQALKEAEVEFSKRCFWRFVSAVDRDYRESTGFSEDSIVLTVRPPNKSSFALVSDGQHRFFAIRGLLRDDLSNRDMRAVLGAVAEEIEASAEAGSTIAFLARVHQKLFSEIALRVQKRSWWLAPLRIDAGPTSVRDRVLAFVLHTGISPPPSAASRPAVGRALFDTAAHKVAYETICRRETRSNLSHRLCGGSAQTRYHPRARGRPAFGGIAQPAGCRRHRSDYSLAQLA